MKDPPLLFLGVGPVALAVAERLAGSRKIFATTRSVERVDILKATGCEVIVMPVPQPEAIEDLCRGSDVLVSFPPDGSTDALLAPACQNARCLTYISSTRVFGSFEGKVDDNTTPAEHESEAMPRLAAEQIWRAVGGNVLRPAGIYGLHSNLLKRLKHGNITLTADSTRITSRIQVEDLARIILAVFSQKLAGKTYVVADKQPASQIEVIEWLCGILNCPVPESSTGSNRQVAIRGRLVDASGILGDLGVGLKYPTYKEGYIPFLKAYGESTG